MGADIDAPAGTTTVLGSAATVTGRSSRLRLFRGPPCAVAILVSPLENLVDVHPVLTRHSRNRRTRYKCRLNNPVFLLSGAVNPFRRATCGNLNRLAHNAIVGQITESVYAVRSGLLHWIYGVMSVLAALFMWGIVPETKGRSLEQMQKLWQAAVKK